jgi:hypothetical protein
VHSENEDIRDTAFCIMGQIPSEKMRDVARSIISDGNELENGIELLCRNFKKEDENTLCSCCRWRIVELMNQHKVLTKQILNECIFDSNNDIRVLAKRKLKSLGIAMITPGK